MMDSPDRPRFFYSYTVLLFVSAGVALLLVYADQTLVSRQADDPQFVTVMRFVQAIEVIFCTLALTVGILRMLGHRVAIPTTPAVSVLLIFWFPVGTAAFVYWVGWVRKWEQRNRITVDTAGADEEPHRVPFVYAYTVLLYVCGGLALMAVAAHWMLIEMMLQDGAVLVARILLALLLLEVALCVLASAAGVLRTIGHPAAIQATSAVSALLVLWIPLGTAVFVYWVRRVRRRERGGQEAVGAPAE
jgi:hypothetical protein